MENSESPFFNAQVGPLWEFLWIVGTKIPSLKGSSINEIKRFGKFFDIPSPIFIPFILDPYSTPKTWRHLWTTLSLYVFKLIGTSTFVKSMDINNYSIFTFIAFLLTILRPKFVMLYLWFQLIKHDKNFHLHYFHDYAQRFSKLNTYEFRIWKVRN